MLKRTKSVEALALASGSSDESSAGMDFVLQKLPSTKREGYEDDGADDEGDPDRGAEPDAR